MEHTSVSENHLRGISTTLALLDETLAGFERWARGEESLGVLYHEHNSLAPPQRRAIRAEVRHIRQRLRELRDALHLDVKSCNAADLIWAWCWTLLEPLHELSGKHLRRYGKPPPELVEYLNPRVAQLCRHVENILGIAAQARATARCQSPAPAAADPPGGAEP